MNIGDHLSQLVNRVKFWTTNVLPTFLAERQPANTSNHRMDDMIMSPFIQKHTHTRSFSVPASMLWTYILVWTYQTYETHPHPNSSHWTQMHLPIQFQHSNRFTSNMYLYVCEVEQKIFQGHSIYFEIQNRLVFFSYFLDVGRLHWGDDWIFVHSCPLVVKYFKTKTL